MTERPTRSQRLPRSSFPTITAAAAGLLIGLSLLGPITAYARPDMAFTPPIERMAEQLDLTDAQRNQMRRIMEENLKQREQLRLEMRKRLDAVLTPEQRAKRDTALRERLGRRLDRMTDRLELSDEQVDKIRQLFESQQKDPSLSKSQVRERLSEILTEEQRAGLRRAGMPDHRPIRREPPRPDERRGCD